MWQEGGDNLAGGFKITVGIKIIVFDSHSDSTSIKH